MTNLRPARRLNPFLFPPETNFRFLLLIAAVLGASFFIYRSLANALLRSEFGQVAQACATAVAGAKPCWDPFERKQALLMVAGVLAVMIVAYVIYWIMPWWKIRQNHLAPFAREDAPEMFLYLDTLCQQTELRHPPTFLVDPFNPTIDGLAFGRRGHYYVLLTARLVACYSKDKALFQAVVSHELAHLKNVDVDKTFFTIALWYAFLLIAFIPFAISLLAEIARFGTGEITLLIQVAWRAVLLGALVFTIRNSILRVREFYADLRAGAIEGTIEPLIRVLSGKPAPAGRWQYFGLAHPPPAHRQQVLVDPSPLFRLGFMEAFGAGLAIAVAIHNLVFWLTLLLPVHLELAAYLIALLFFAPLTVGVVGLGTWRGAFASVVLGSFPLRLGRISLGLGLGLAAGRILSFHAVVEPLGWNSQWMAVLTSDVAWGVLLIAILYLFLHWVKIGALAWLATVISVRSLRRVYTVSFVICALLLAWWLGALLLAAEISRTLATETPAAILIVGRDFFARLVIGRPSGIVALIPLLAFPLAGWLARRRLFAISDAHWVFLDAVTGEKTR